MKLKTLFHLLGFKPKPREYGYFIRTMDMESEGSVQYAQWLHPQESIKEIDQEEVDHLRTILSPGDVAIDIGAHTGDTTLPIALAVGKTGHVLALEPNPYVGRILDVNAQLNMDKATIEPLKFAATPHDGLVEFEYSDPGFCNGGRHEGIRVWRHGHVFKLTVEGRNLENYLRLERAELIDRLKFIKTDAEGYDLAIIRTLSDLIAETRPYIKSEIYKHTSRSQRIEFFETLRQMSYQIRKIVSDTNYFGQIIDEENVMDWRHFDVLCIPQERIHRHQLAA